ncbi:MAG: polysaccharide ABC transporter ATP-binding protein [Ferruginibacter sp.]
MSKIIIKAENISKQYRLGEVGTGTLSHDVNRWWHRIRGKEDPYLKLGDKAAENNGDYVWALNDVSFEIKQGEVLGIIGRNGAGKSTLLKLLSRVTAPTTGVIKVDGRIASLLEVGTGFHPELTGRENIYLNGAILGMTKKEITRQFDAILDFTGVEKYIDTPVKRYSSGMYVRLAFAVAAHLEPEILIVDEVLAVGDAEFQKKCLWKMEDVSTKEGRTVLFVSHNIDHIKSLTRRAIYLRNGSISADGETNSVVNTYYESIRNMKLRVLKDTGDIVFSGISNYSELAGIPSDKNIRIACELRSNVNLRDLYFDIAVKDSKDNIVLHFKTEWVGAPFEVSADKRYNLLFDIGSPGLVQGSYTLELYVFNKHGEVLLWYDNIDLLTVAGNTSIFKDKIISDVKSPVLKDYSIRLLPLDDN